MFLKEYTYEQQLVCIFINTFWTWQLQFFLNMLTAVFKVVREVSIFVKYYSHGYKRQ